MIPGPITLVAVVFEAEIPLLQLQARSAALYLAPGDVAEILVIDNTRSGLTAGTRERLLRAYGPHRGAVSFVRPLDLVAVPAASGWYVQQLLKLAVASRITTGAYVALDAKDHFVRPSGASDFVDPDGRGKVPVYPYQTHPLRPDLERALAYLGMEPEPYLERFTATVTPFTFETAAVRELVEDVGAGSGLTGFAAEFIGSRLLEFFLYSSWLIRKRGSLSAAFAVLDQASPKVWKSTASAAGVAAAIGLAETRGTPMFSVHRRAMAILGPAATGRLAQYWVRSGLFPNQAVAIAFILRFKATYLARELVRKGMRPRAARSGG